MMRKKIVEKISNLRNCGYITTILPLLGIIFHGVGISNSKRFLFSRRFDGPGNMQYYVNRFQFQSVTCNGSVI